MSAKPAEAKGGVCANFEPQAWRKNVCKNCFHSKKEHNGSSNGNSTTPASKGSEKVAEKPTEKVENVTGTKKDKPTDSIGKIGSGTGIKTKSIDIGISYGQPKKSETQQKQSETDTKDVTKRNGGSGKTSAEKQTVDNTSTSGAKTNHSGDLTSSSSLSTSSTGTGSKTGPSTKSSTSRGGSAFSHLASKFGDSGKPKPGVSVSSSLKLSKEKDVAKEAESGKEVKLVSISTTSISISSIAVDNSVKDVNEKHSKKEPEPTTADGSKEPSGNISCEPATATGAGNTGSGGGSFSFVKRLSKSFSEDEASSDAQETPKQSKEQQVEDKSTTQSKENASAKSQSPEKKLASPKTTRATAGGTGKGISAISSKFLGNKNQKDRDKEPLRGNGKSKDKDTGDKISVGKATSVSSPKSSLKNTSKQPDGRDKEKEKDKGSSVSLNRSNSCPSPKSSLRHVTLSSRDKDTKERNGAFKTGSSSPSPKSSLRLVTTKDRDSQEKNGSRSSSSPSPKSTLKHAFPRSHESKADKDKDTIKEEEVIKVVPTSASFCQTDFNDKAEVDQLRQQIAKMEEQCKKLELENKTLSKSASEKDEFRKSMEELRTQLSSMEKRCYKLEGENQNLSSSLKNQKQQMKEADDKKVNTAKDAQDQFKETERLCNILRQENEELQQEIKEIKQEMDEMYDQFRESEADEYRDLQKELEITAKNCRILQFKLRKAERKNDQVDTERMHYEDKIRTLQNQFEDNDAKQHIQTLEEELKMAKDVSVRLHDELDLTEERRGRLEDENTKLQDVLAKQDKKEFRMEMEIDKLTDRLDELQKQLARAKRQLEDDPNDHCERTQKRPVLQTQVSTEYEVSQILRDLYDSLERENDLKDQLHFTEEEIKLMRKKLKEMEEENENLNFQLKKMSSTKSIMTVRKVDEQGEERDVDFEPSQCEMQLKLELDLSEQEAAVLRKKFLDMEQQNETYLEEIGTLAKRLNEKEKAENVLPAPSSPSAYYEDKIKEMTIQSDELKWKLIEKEREIERLGATVNIFQSHSRTAKLKKSKSLDSDFQILDLKRQLDLVTQEADLLRQRVSRLESENGKLAYDNKRLQLQSTRKIPSIQADDAAVENIELRDKAKKLEDEKRSLKEKLKSLTENIHSLTKPKDGTRGRQQQHAAESDPSKPAFDSQLSRESEEQLRLVEEEAAVLRRKMAELESQNSKLTRQLERTKAKQEKSTDDQNDARQDDTDDGKTVEELRDKIADMQEEIKDLLLIINSREQVNTDLERHFNEIKKAHTELKDEFRKTEIELLQDLEMSHQKSDVLSNLLDLVSERAEATEKELERVINESPSPSSNRSARSVSALSDASTGSDDVFQIPASPTGDKPVVAKDWENQFKKRVECLERLLAEERHKVAAAEKKLSLVSEETLSSAMSDDVKLRMREKEIMQNEIVENQKHLLIANDQIRGLRERMQVVEESNHKLRMDYEALVRELDRREALEEQTTLISERGSTSSASSVQGLQDQLKEYKDMAEQLQQTREQELEAQVEIDQLKHALAKYKLKSEELEYKVEEINEIWVSKSAASEKEKMALEAQHRTLEGDLLKLRENVYRLQNDLRQKDSILATSDHLLKEKDELVKKRDDIIQQQEDIIKNRDGDFQTMLDQISQRDDAVRDLREALRIRDERLREKDDIIQRINVNMEQKQRDMINLEGVTRESMVRLNDKDVEIQQLRSYLHDMTGPLPDVAKESNALQMHIDDLHKTMAKLEKEIGALNGEVVRLRDELCAKEQTWQLEKSNLITEAKTYKEKYNAMEALKKLPEDGQVSKLTGDHSKLIEEKETLLGEVRKLQIEMDNTAKRSQNEATDMKRRLDERNKIIEEKSSFGERLQHEVARLRTQAELAFRLQQEEKILRAELLAMKVRYETRLEKLQREYSKLQMSAEKIQRDRDLHRDIIKGVQRGMSELKARYTQDVAGWQEEKLQLERKIKEVDENRKLVFEMKRLAEDLKTKVADQERMRANSVNAFNTEKTAWEIEKSNMQSRMNQLEEKLSTTSKVQAKTKDIQSKIEVTWEKERTEQKRLLVEAHNLALDLQQQLKSRDEEHVKERRDLVNKHEVEKIKWESAKKEGEKKIAELEGYTKRIVSLQEQFQEVKDRDNSEKEAWQREKCDLVRRLTDARQFQIRQNRKIDDILHTLKRLRELATLVHDVETAEELVRMSPDGLPDGIPDHEQLQRTLDHAVLKYMRDSIHQLNAIMSDLDRYLESVKDELPNMRRSLSTSQVDEQNEEEADSVVAPKEDVPRAERTARKHELNVSSSPRSADSSPTRFARSHTYDDSSGDPKPGTEHVTRGRVMNVSGAPHPPSYASGSRSAQSSRAASPDKHHIRSSFSPVRKITNYPDPPPSFLISPPHQPNRSPIQTLTQDQDVVTSADMAHIYQRLARPQHLTKSISVDSAPLSSFAMGAAPSSVPMCSPQIPSVFFSNSGGQNNSGLEQDSRQKHTGDSLVPHGTGSLDRMSPRTARKKFFADDQPPTTVEMGYQPWVDRRNPQVVQQALVPSEQLIQTPSELNTDLFPFDNIQDQENISPLDPHQIEMLYYPAHGAVARNLPPLEKPPMSWDEKVNIVDNTGLESTEKSKTIGPVPGHFVSFPVQQPKSATIGAIGVKEKRKFFRKSSSLDNTSVSASLGKVGMQMLPPGVPSGFSPSDLFAAVKRKFRPNLKKNLQPGESKISTIPISKSADDMADITGSATRGRDAFRSADVSPALTPSTTSPETSPFHIPLQSTENQPSWDPASYHVQKDAPPGNTDPNAPSVPSLTHLFPKPPTPPNRRPPRRWRSKSADRAEKPRWDRQARKPILLHADVITPIRVWKFSETSV